MTRPPLVATTLCTILVMACLLQAAGTSHAASGGTPCSGTSLQYTLTCYPPDQVRKAERLLPVAPIDPSRAVAKITGLSLAQVVAAKRLLPKPRRRVVLLEFDYGSFPAGSQGIPNPSPPTPKWVVVNEFAEHWAGVKGVMVSRGYSQTVTSGTVTSAVAYNWELRTNLPGHKLAVFITTNQDEATIRQIGRELIREAKQKGTRA